MSIYAKLLAFYRGQKSYITMSSKVLQRIALHAHNYTQVELLHAYIAVYSYPTLLTLSIAIEFYITPLLMILQCIYMVRMCRSIQSVLVVACVVTLSHHIQLGKSQNDGKYKKKTQYHCLYNMI